MFLCSNSYPVDNKHLQYDNPLFSHNNNKPQYPDYLVSSMLHFVQHILNNVKGKNL